MAKIIIIDDEPGILQVMRKLAERMGHETSAYQSGKDGMAAIQRVIPDVVVVDLRIGDMSGLEIIQRCHSQYPHIAIIMVTGYGTVESAVEAMKLGAFDYLTKPFELDDLQRTVNRALSQRDSSGQSHPAALITDTDAEPALVASRLIGESQRMKEIHAITEKIADNDSPILLEGEFGAGKQMVARAIHNRSKRNAAPFKVLDCSSLPEDLLEMELFGSPGGRGETIFRRAMGGTVFLEEINLLPQRLQSLLEGYLEDITARRMNNSLPESMDVRFVASTNKPLEEEVSDCRFREDLYYKVSVIPINVPSLRNRQSDIPLLVEYFLERYAAMNKRPKPQVDKYASELLESYKWPGNVSELQNTVERACAFCEDGRIRPVHHRARFPNAWKSPTTKTPQLVHHLPIGNTLNDFIRKQEKLFIRETLKYNEGSRRRRPVCWMSVSLRSIARWD